MNNSLSLTSPFILKRQTFLRWKTVFKLILAVSVFLAGTSLVFYIFQVCSEVSERYLIQREEQRLNNLTAEVKKMEVISVQAESLDNIMNLIKNTSFEKAEKIHYIRVVGNKVVAK